MSQELILYVQNNHAPELPEARKVGWELIGRGKLVMDAQLQKHGAAQSVILHNYETMSQDAIATAIKAYKSGYDLIVSVRQEFTKHLDFVKEKCMEVEKAWDPKTNITFLAAVKQELKLREDAVNKANAATAKVNEAAAFKAHTANQFAIQLADYHAQLWRIISEAYVTCLNQKTPVDNITPAITACISAMKEVRPVAMVKYSTVYGPFKYHSIEEVAAIFATITQPDFKGAFGEEMELAKEKFSMYANDLANSEMAVAQQTALFKEKETEATQALEATCAANTLIEQAQAMTVAPAGVKGVTEMTKIKLVDDKDWGWCVKIMTAFAQNINKTKEKVRAKTVHALTVAQMAAALDSCGVKIEGIEYETIKK